MFFDLKNRILGASSAVKLLLTIVQLIAGIYSGSMALIADALHNFADCSMLIIALVARIIAQKPPDSYKTFGYKKIELVAALMNFTSIIVIGFYLIIEAVGKASVPHTIEGEIVIFTAIIAFVVNAIIAVVLFRVSGDNLNLKAVFIDSFSDTLGSVAVFISGVLIYYYKIEIADTVISILIALYIIYNAVKHLPKAIDILIAAKPKNINLSSVITTMEEVEGVINVHHLHLWQLDEVETALEAHVVTQHLEKMEDIKYELKLMLKDKFSINHSTLEFEKYVPGFEKDSCNESENKN